MTKRYVYDGTQLLMAFEGGALKARYLWGPAVDQILADEVVTSTSTPGTTRWMLGDNLNTVRDVVSNSGTVLNHLAYSSFGILVSQTNSANQPFILWTGRPYESTLGLQNNWHRWYDPVLGKWISEDPIGFGGGDGNLNRYVSNGPVLYFDPTGFEDEWGSGGWWYLNPWAYNFPFGQHGVTNWLGGVYRAQGEGADMERRYRTQERLKQYAAPAYAFDPERLQRTYRLGDNEAAIAKRELEVGIGANAAVLGGIGLRPGFAGVGDDLVRFGASKDVGGGIAGSAESLMISPRYGKYVNRIDRYRHALAREHVMTALREKNGAVTGISPQTGKPALEGNAQRDEWPARSHYFAQKVPQ